MSPVFMNTFYGNAGGWQGMRMGGYRPYVFFKTGLELGFGCRPLRWRAGGSGVAGPIKRIGQFPLGSVLLPILMGTTILCRSTGALALLLIGMTVLWLSVRFRTRLLLVGLLFVGPVYSAVRSTNQWSGQQAVDLADALVGPYRAQSLEFRFLCENTLCVKALEKPMFGWGGWDRSAVIRGGPRNES